MPKSRYSLLDVIASKRDLLTCVGYRVNNIYDINAKTYAIKLHQSGTEAGKIGSTKKLLLLESGVRFHLTSFTRDKSDNPSPFTMKLRKHLRGKRLVDVQQLGMDRVVCFTFGSGEASYHLILELYDKGNIILCDYRYGIFSNNFTKKIIRILNEKNCEIYVDQQSTTKDPDISKFKNINYLILNNLEYKKIFKIYKIDGKNLLTKLSKLQKIFNIKSFVVKTGSKGCLVFKNNKIIKSKPPPKFYSNLNTIGAGDYFLACFVNKYKENLPKRIKLSNDYAFSKIIGKSKVKKY